MSVLINMEMPQSAREAILINYNGRALKIRADRIIVQGGLICDNKVAYELPPHGDLIDRDELCKGLSDIHPVAKYANKMPTVIDAEEGEQ